MYKNESNLRAEKVWSADNAICYSFQPTSGSYDSGTGVLTFIYEDHNLTSGDVVNSVGPAGWVDNTETVTVTNKDTFTITVATGRTNFPDPSLFANAGAFTIVCSKYSKLMYAPTVIQSADLTGANTVQIQAKVHRSAEWLLLTTLNDASNANFYLPNARYNYVRCVLSGGTTHGDVYAQ